VDEENEEWQMNANLRACIANIAAQLRGVAVGGAVYDHSQGKHIHVSGNASRSAVNVYDHDRGEHISGAPPNLYDHGLGNHVSLSVRSNQFNGYDHDSGSHYSGTINGSSVTIYDHEDGQHHHYSV
jgi:hypothetical protein